MRFFWFMGGLLDRLFVVAGAFLGSQIPAFIQQYSQRLSGHVDELNHLLKWMQESANHSGKTLEQYMVKFLHSTDPDFIQQGLFMKSVISRWKIFSTSLNHLQESSLWSKFYIFLKEMQYEVAQPTFLSFQPNLALSLEGFCYTGIGILVGYVFYHIVIKIFGFGVGRALSFVKQGI